MNRYLFVRTLLVALCLASSFERSLAADAPLTSAEAAKKVGEKVTVELKVQFAGRNGDFLELYSAKDWKADDCFFLRFSGPARERFAAVNIPDVVDYFFEKTVRATGEVKLLDFGEFTKPVVYVENVEQIEVVAAKREVAPTRLTRKMEDVGIGEVGQRAHLEEQEQFRKRQEDQARDEEKYRAAEKTRQADLKARMQDKAKADQIAELSRQQDRNRVGRFMLGLFVSLFLIAVVVIRMASRPLVIGTTSVRGAIVAASGLLPILTLGGIWFLEVDYATTAAGADENARLIAAVIGAAAFVVGIIFMVLGTLITGLDKGLNFGLALVLAMITPLGLLIASLLPGQPFPATGGRRVKTLPAKRPLRKKTALNLLLFGAFLIIGPIIQLTLLPRPKTTAPANASPAARGYIEGSKSGASVGTVISMIVGLALVAGGVKGLVASQTDGTDNKD